MFRRTCSILFITYYFWNYVAPKAIPLDKIHQYAYILIYWEVRTAVFYTCQYRNCQGQISFWNQSKNNFGTKSVHSPRKTDSSFSITDTDPKKKLSLANVSLFLLQKEYKNPFKSRREKVLNLNYICEILKNVSHLVLFI